MTDAPPDLARIVANRWMRWADEDLRLAKHTLAGDDVVPRGACVWAHQAAEKAIKALIAAQDVDPPKLHDLDRLVQRLPAEVQAPFLEIDLPELTRWAIEGRYPDELADATSDDARQAISLASDVLDLAHSALYMDDAKRAGPTEQEPTEQAPMESDPVPTRGDEAHEEPPAGSADTGD